MSHRPLTQVLFAVLPDMDASSLPDVRSFIIQWLTKWHGQASRTGSKMEFVYKNALNSIKAHDGPIKTAEDCSKIKYFGKTCNDFTLSHLHSSHRNRS